MSFCAHCGSLLTHRALKDDEFVVVVECYGWFCFNYSEKHVVGKFIPGFNELNTDNRDCVNAFLTSFTKEHRMRLFKRYFSLLEETIKTCINTLSSIYENENDNNNHPGLPEEGFSEISLDDEEGKSDHEDEERIEIDSVFSSSHIPVPLAFNACGPNIVPDEIWVAINTMVLLVFGETELDSLPDEAEKVLRCLNTVESTDFEEIAYYQLRNLYSLYKADVHPN